MVSNAFDLLLNDLGAALKIKDLNLDEHNTCLIKFPSGLQVYIEPSNREEGQALIYTNIAELPVGRFREDVLKEALKANGFSYPRYGIFAFSEGNQQLVLFQFLPMKNLTGERVADFLDIFMKRALAWKDPITRNEVPIATTLENSGSAIRSQGFFGGLIR